MLSLKFLRSLTYDTASWYGVYANMIRIMMILIKIVIIITKHLRYNSTYNRQHRQFHTKSVSK